MVYKLYYFDIRGRAEPIRQLLALGHQPYEDIRISAEEWPAFKSKTPLGSMPFMEIDGIKLGQSLAIMRFLGHKFNRAGSCPMEEAKLNMIADTIQDFLNQEGPAKLSYVIMGIIKISKEEFYKTKIVPAIEIYAPIINNFLRENGSKGVFVGDRETWTDIFAAEVFCRLVDFVNPHCIDAYPEIKALVKRVHSLPEIKKYLEQRKPSIC